jgi:L-alanine-DL-glutamate epimerase-like enolase superfamily enzyme
MKIEKIEIFVIGPEDKHYTWSEDIPEIYQTNTIIRMFTDSNIIGEAAVWNATYFDYDKYTAESLKHLLPILIGKDPLDRESILYDIRPRVFPQPPGAQALIDNALWDIFGKHANLPVYKLLGGRRDKIKSYASTVMYESIDEYLKVIDEMEKKDFQL